MSRLVATWNVNGLRARLDFVRLWLRDQRPDVVCLQELKLTDDLFPVAELEEEGYHAAVHGQPAWNGVAVLSREPVELVRRGLPGQEDFGARLVTARTGDLLVTSVYVPNGKSISHDDYERKLAWLDALGEHLEGGADDSAWIVGGDFNVCPAPIDSWNEEKLAGSIFHTDEERRRIARLIDAGFVDLHRECKPEERVFSWWDYRGGAFHRGHGLRIDLLFGTADLAKRVKDAEIHRDWRKKHDGLTPSDHAPVVIQLSGG